MTNKELNILISKGEGLTVEFKKTENQLPKNLFETVCAFLNRNGGTILLGVADNKEIIGIQKNKATQLCKEFINLSNNKQKLDPPFLLHAKTLEYFDKNLIYIFVPASSQVHKTAGKIFDRGNDGDYELTTNEQISNLYIQKSTYYSENTIYPYLKEEHFVNGFLEKTMQRLKNVRPAHPWLNLDKEEFFKSAGLYRTDLKTGEKGFTQAALLLFGKEEVILSAIPQYKTDAILRRKDLDRYDDRENIRCNLIDAYEKLMDFVAKHLPDKFYLMGDVRVSLREKIFREIIANFLMHREFNNALPSTFIIYEDKVVV